MQIVFAGFNNDDVDSAMNTVEFSVSYCIRKWTV